MMNLDLLTVSGLLMLASAPVECSFSQTPMINVVPTTQDIRYDFSKSRAELGRFQTQTVSPYAAGVDMMTGGLRRDTPVIRTTIEWHIQTWPRLEQVCMAYSKVNISIELRPEIFVAREYQNNRACHDAILEHERMHVRVDREVMNKYAVKIGQAVKDAVNQTGTVGPYRLSDRPAIERQMVARIENAIEDQKTALHHEMNIRQAEIDTLEEYERISVLCHVR